MSPYTIFALGIGLGIFGGVILSALLTSASRTDHEARRMYREEMRRRGRMAEAEAEDHRERCDYDWSRIGVG